MIAQGISVVFGDRIRSVEKAVNRLHQPLTFQQVHPDYRHYELCNDT